MNTETLEENNYFAIWGFTGTLVWTTVIAFSFILIQIAVMIIFIQFEYADTAPAKIEKIMAEIQNNGLFLSIATIATFIGCSSIIMGIVKLKKGSNIQHYLGLNLVNRASARYWFLIFIGLMCVSELLTYSLGKPLVPEFVTTLYSSTDSLFLLWIAIVIAAPIFEELFFRGFIITGLSSTFMGPIGAIVLSSIAWSAIHIQYDLYLITTIFVFGLLLGYVRLKTNSVLLTIGLHSFMNLASMIETSIILS